MGLNALTRELHANERPQLLTHLLALDAEDRHIRFAHVLSDDGVRRYVEGIDMTRDAVFVVTDTDLAIIGAAHLARDVDEAVARRYRSCIIAMDSVRYSASGAG